MATRGLLRDCWFALHDSAQRQPQQDRGAAQFARRRRASLARAAACIEAGCGGITVHPRPDQRHIRPDDVRLLAQLLRGRVDNIEATVRAATR